MAVDDGGRSPATLRCPACGGEPFPDPRRLAIHMERHREVLSPVRESGTGRELSHRCPKGCGRNFPTLLEFREHSPVCDGSEPLRPLDAAVIAGVGGEERRPLLCPECRIRVDEPEELGYHLERHREMDTGPRPCPKGCGRGFQETGEYDFRRHVKLCRGEKPLPLRGKGGPERTGKGREDGMYECDQCDRTFPRANNLAIHKKYKHAGGRPAPGERGSDVAVLSTPDTSGGDADDDGIEAVVRRLREKAEDHLKKADRIEEIMKELEALL